MKPDRSTALTLLHTYVKNEKMICQCLASEAVMRGLARKLGRNEEDWGLAGLLHDLDVETTNAEATVHGTQTEILLSGYVPEYLYESGRLDTNIPFDQLQKLALINRVAQAADQSPDFSRCIRVAVE